MPFDLRDDMMAFLMLFTTTFHATTLELELERSSIIFSSAGPDDIANSQRIATSWGEAVPPPGFLADLWRLVPIVGRRLVDHLCAVATMAIQLAPLGSSVSTTR